MHVCGAAGQTEFPMAVRQRNLILLPQSTVTIYLSTSLPCVNKPSIMNDFFRDGSSEYTEDQAYQMMMRRYSKITPALHDDVNYVIDPSNAGAL